ncbi:DUF5000 domain-containing lipoprotein [Mucilaginibacter sp. SG564]|uniref:DUF5000 domain-containing lipoprotein n=1 Tax=Mucilaginibacter sp. SG564 TaxID=2587022 RepID=UPI0015537D0F|nr:DUF4959 domain-containing protein [Mucilaginibacter sp. SG564]NOW96038.1 hypothetical protein [Mucilaginibacter sp. SG564]
MKYLKKISVAFYLVWITATIYSCKENKGYNDPVSKDPAKPGVITDVKVDNYNGGTYITYKLPKSQNLLYVLAQYEIRKGVTRETKSSYFSDTVNVEGFARAQEYKVTLYSVTRANIYSDPVVVTVNPKTPVYQLVSRQLSLNADFGGVNVNTLNPLRKDIGVIITAFDKSTNRMEVQDQHYVNADTINYSLRGYDAVLRKFGVYVTDGFGNISDTLSKNLTPLPEVFLDKGKFSAFTLPSDTELGFTDYGFSVQKLWDGKIDGFDGWHTMPGHTAPFVTTFSIGGLYKLSRFVIWERPDDGSNIYSFSHFNPKVFTLWGSSAPNPKDQVLPLTSAVGTVLGDWVNLGNFRYPNPPSGLPPNNHNAADNAFVRAGVGFNFALTNPDVRYIRVAVGQTWSNGDAAHIMELSFYGQPK